MGLLRRWLRGSVLRLCRAVPRLCRSLLLQRRRRAAVGARVSGGRDLVIDLAARALRLHLEDDDRVGADLAGFAVDQPHHVGFGGHPSGEVNRSEVVYVFMRRLGEGLDRAAGFPGLNACRDHVGDDNLVRRQHPDLRPRGMGASRNQRGTYDRKQAQNLSHRHKEYRRAWVRRK